MIWYLLSPYTNYSKGHDQAYEDAKAETIRLFMFGVPVFSPIVYSHPLCKDGNLPVPIDFWEKLDFGMIGFSIGGIVLKLEGWDKSDGVARELEHFRKLGKPILYMDTPIKCVDAMKAVRLQNAIT